MARGYQSYRGRRINGTKLLAALLVLILLAACAFIFVQSFVSYTDDGELHVNLPFLQNLQGSDKKEEEPPPDAGDSEPQGEDVNGVNLVIDGAEEPEEEPEPEPEPVVEVQRRVVELSALPADSAAVAQTMASTGAGGFVCPVRDDTGRVFFTSATAQEKAAVGDEAGTAVLREACAQEGVLAVAKFNCFHDSYYAFVHMQDAAICQKTGYVWYDSHSYHWLDPSKELARSYVIGLAVECAQLGFDELLLEEMAYPVNGKLEKIDYSGNTMGKTEALTLFLTELRAALEPYGTKISLLLSEDLIQAGSSETTGQDLAALLPLVDAVYASVSDQEGARELMRQAMGGAEPPELVPLLGEAHEGSWCIPAE